jgi:Ca-activated chloride channel family protein
MTSEHARGRDDIHLADAPAPSPAARQAAIANALARFDEKNRARRQGSTREERLMRQTAIPPSRRRSVMPRARYAIAASLVALMAGSASWVYIHESSIREESRLPRPVPQIAVEADRLAALPPPSVNPPTAQADAPQPAPQASAAPKTAEAPQSAPSATPPPAHNFALRGAPDPAAPAPAKPMADARRDTAKVMGRLEQAPGSAAAPSRTRQAESFAPAQRVAPSEPMPPAEPAGRDKFAGAAENGFKTVREAPVSTFSIDVDTASYAFVRASLSRNVLPQPAAVRTEELVNYFPYAYPAPTSASEPFRTTVAVFPSPWSAGRKIVHVGIKGYAVQAATRPRANLVFLIDTSGSMNAPNRLPLVKQSLAMLLTQLEANDRVAIVTYAGNAGTALEPTAASEKARILGVLERLEAGGSTAGAEGIRQAYALAEQSFDPNGVNRVILATDGDFNVGITDRDELKGFIERQRGKGIFLSVLGFGMGNYNDALMQALAQNGNGAAAYIDTINEARKVLVEEATSTLIPIAKDVKIQVEFNPATVAEYRLIGYETRLLNRDDFANDKVDAGDVGSGQTATALYEIVLVGGPRLTDDLRYGEASRAAGTAAPAAAEYAFVKIRYKLPTSDVSALITTPVDRASEHAQFAEASNEARFATSVAAFAEILRGGRFTGTFGYDDVLRTAAAARGDDPFGYRSEFLQLVRAAKTASAMQPLRP